jgi:glycosyltransferase involved in cell wall biosynthesis
LASHNDSNKLIYSSSPDRGLEQLISIWPHMKKRYPDLELHIYYGWHMIDKIIEHYKDQGVNAQASYLKNFKTKIVHHIDHLGGEEAGIFQHGRVNQDDLAKAMMNSNIWPYPTAFSETFAITAIEMQAAGVIPVTSNLAALTETVAPYYEKLDGWPSNNDYQSRFLKLFAMSYEYEEYREEGKQLGRQHAESHSWERAYSIWNDNINEIAK